MIHRLFSKAMKNVVAIGLLANSILGCAAASSNWKEEVLLHDGRKMMVERSQTYRGRSEPGQSAPIGEHRMTFTPPGSGQRITWVSEYDDKIGRTNFLPLALHVADQTPYVVAYPNLCLSYQKWGRPNPPYVVFAYKTGTWTRISLKELPEQFTTVNLTLGAHQLEAEEMRRAGLVTAERVQAFNKGVGPPQIEKIIRTPLSDAAINEMCPRISSGPKAPS